MEGRDAPMKDNYTHITAILDRSGSMESIRDDIIGGFNAFLREQKETAGMATLTLVQFDTGAPYEVIHSFTLIQAVRSLTDKTYVPRGGTPLLDAVGQGINELDATLARMPETERPSRVVFVIVTDGMENASREFSREQVAQMIAQKQEVAGWNFLFLSADLAAVHEAEAMNVRFNQSLGFDRTAEGTRAAMRAASSRIKGFREGPDAILEFDEADRAEQQIEQRRKPK